MRKLESGTMLIRNLFYAFIALIVGGSLSAVGSSVYALTTTERNDIIDKQSAALEFTGSYQPVYDDLVKVFTYETLCKGFYAVEDNGTIIKYTGFGDLAENYTYETESPYYKQDIVATSTKDIIVNIPVDTPLLTEPF